MSGTWGGSTVRAARARWRPIVNAGDAVCWRCGRPIVPNPDLPHDGWQVGHIEDLALGGAHGHENQAPEHSRCNTSAGGRLGAAITNARRSDRPTTTARLAPERDRRITPRW
jgi:hypothetical protein